MDMTELGNLIGVYGFPVVACCVLMYYIKYVEDKHREEISALNDKHAEESKAMTEAINNNTNVLTKIWERLGGLSNEGDN